MGVNIMKKILTIDTEIYGPYPEIIEAEEEKDYLDYNYLEYN